MKYKIFLICFFLLNICKTSFSQLTITDVEPLTGTIIAGRCPIIGLWDKFEIGIATTPFTFSNPYDPDIVSVSAEFWSVDNPSLPHIFRNGFWYVDFVRNTGPSGSAPPDAGTLCAANQSYTDENPLYLQPTIPETPLPWRIRFSTNVPGNWQYSITTSIPPAAGTDAPITVTAGPFCFFVSKNTTTKKLVKVGSNQRYFCDDNDVTVFPMGINADVYNGGMIGNQFIYSRAPFNYMINTIDQLSSNNANLIRRFMDPGAFGIEWNEPGGGLGNYEPRQNRMYDLDKILEEAEMKNVFIQFVIDQNFEMFTNNIFLVNPSYNWWDDVDPSLSLNPYSTICHRDDFFIYPSTATDYYRRKLRYIIARWDYSPSIFSYELFNEVDQAVSTIWSSINRPNIVNWHNQMINYMKGSLGTQHMITTSTAYAGAVNAGRTDPGGCIMQTGVDYIQGHTYSKDWGIDHQQNYLTKWAIKLQPDKPFFLGEEGNNGDECGAYSSSLTSPTLGYGVPGEYDWNAFHNTIWSSAVSGASASALYYDWVGALYPSGCTGGADKSYRALYNFMSGEDLSHGDIISIANPWPFYQTGPMDNTSVPHYSPSAALYATLDTIPNPDDVANSITTTDDNDLEIFALKKEEKIIGWVHDKANYWYYLPHNISNPMCTYFGTSPGYPWLIPVVPPQTVTVSNLFCDGFYKIEFYNTYPDITGVADGAVIPSYTEDWIPAACGTLTFHLPPLGPLGNGDPLIMPDYGFKITSEGDFWDHWYVTNNTDQAIVGGSIMGGGMGSYFGYPSISTGSNHVVYEGPANRIHHLVPDGADPWANSWASMIFDDGGDINQDVNGQIVMSAGGQQVWYRGMDKRLQCYYRDGSAWDHMWLTDWSSSSENFSNDNPYLDLNDSDNMVVYSGTDTKIHLFQYAGSGIWIPYYLDPGTDPDFLVGDVSQIKITADGTQVYYAGADGKLQCMYFYVPGSTWYHTYITDLSGTPQNVVGPLAVASAAGKVFFRGSDGYLHVATYTSGGWDINLVTDGSGANVLVASYSYLSCSNDGNLVDFEGGDQYPEQLFNPIGTEYSRDYIICYDDLMPDMETFGAIAMLNDGIHNVKTFYGGVNNDVQVYSYNMGCNPRANTAERPAKNHHLVVQDTVISQRNVVGLANIADNTIKKSATISKQVTSDSLPSSNSTMQPMITTASNSKYSQVTAVSLSSPGSIQDVISNSSYTTRKISIFPNPTNTFLNVDIGNFANENNNYDIRISDIVGSEIEYVQVEKNITKIDTKNLVPGVYVLTIRQNNIVIYVDKVIKLNE